MLEMIMFGIVLTVAITAATLLSWAIMMKVMFSDKFWKKMAKMSMTMVKQMEEMEDEELYS